MYVNGQSEKTDKLQFVVFTQLYNYDFVMPNFGLFQIIGYKKANIIFEYRAMSPPNTFILQHSQVKTKT